MAWETRRGRQYYYRKKRVGTKVVSEYVGTGQYGQFMELMDLISRQEREEELRQFQDLVTEEKHLAQEFRQSQMKAAQAAEAVGICRRRGEWRKRCETLSL
jgi:predicted XRE-type DNA-binding protein